MTTDVPSCCLLYFYLLFLGSYKFLRGLSVFVSIFICPYSYFENYFEIILDFCYPFTISYYLLFFYYAYLSFANFLSFFNLRIYSYFSACSL